MIHLRLNNEMTGKTTAKNGTPSLGLVEGRLLFAAFTMRGEVIRIISARAAEPFERREYHEQEP
jgi:uncharacterized DUF497 family protein